MFWGLCFLYLLFSVSATLKSYILIIAYDFNFVKRFFLSFLKLSVFFTQNP